MRKILKNGSGSLPSPPREPLAVSNLGTGPGFDSIDGRFDYVAVWGTVARVRELYEDGPAKGLIEKAALGNEGQWPWVKRRPVAMGKS